MNERHECPICGGPTDFQGLPCADCEADQYITCSSGRPVREGEAKDWLDGLLLEEEEEDNDDQVDLEDISDDR